MCSDPLVPLFYCLFFIFFHLYFVLKADFLIINTSVIVPSLMHCANDLQPDILNMNWWVGFVTLNIASEVPIT